MKQLQLILGSALILGFTSCQSPKTITKKQSSKDYSSLQNNGKIYAAFYQQNSAEYKALCLQAYNIAKLRLDEAIANKKEGKPIAIISDIDETMVDNSYNAVEIAKKGDSWTQESWENWTAKGIATPLEGSLEFFNYAASKGVNIFYVTNRNYTELQGTLKNLKKYGFPLQSEKHLILRKGESSKELRRQNIAKDYDIVLLLGDNLTDFSYLFDNHKTKAEREEAVKKLKNEFGKQFIVFPNNSYGDWENTMFNYENLPQSKRDSIIYKSVKEMPIQ